MKRVGGWEGEPHSLPSTQCGQRPNEEASILPGGTQRASGRVFGEEGVHYMYPEEDCGRGEGVLGFRDEGRGFGLFLRYPPYTFLSSLWHYGTIADW